MLLGGAERLDDDSLAHDEDIIKSSSRDVMNYDDELKKAIEIYG